MPKQMNDWIGRWLRLKEDHGELKAGDRVKACEYMERSGAGPLKVCGAYVCSARTVKHRHEMMFIIPEDKLTLA
jgi:hypothetical protein